MEVQGVRINELVSQSMVVITKPSVESFERFEKSGGKREALVYVLVAAALSGIVSAIFGLLAVFPEFYWALSRASSFQ